MGLFNPQGREEQARCVCCGNSKFGEEIKEGSIINVGVKPTDMAKKSKESKKRKSISEKI